MSRETVEPGNGDLVRARMVPGASRVSGKFLVFPVRARADTGLCRVSPQSTTRKATMTTSTRSKSQLRTLARYLLTGRSITPAMAHEVWGIRRLAARVLDLKKAGVPVQRCLKRDPAGARYAEYYLMLPIRKTPVLNCGCEQCVASRTLRTIAGMSLNCAERP